MKGVIIFIFIQLNAYSQSIIESKYTNNTWAFEENKGQVTGNDAQKVNFFYTSGNMTMFILKTGIAYQFNKTTRPADYENIDNFDSKKEINKHEEKNALINTESYRMDIELIGAKTNPIITTEDKSINYIQYYNHNALGVHAFSKLIYHDIYPNVDWVIYKTDKGIKYDFIVHPGGNPKDIKLKTKWVEDLKLNEDGSISIKNRMGEVIEKAPLSFQNEKQIQTQFKINDNIIQFKIEDYDLYHDLVIDPTIIWSTYYGGLSGDGGVHSYIDYNSNVYFAGYTYSNTVIASGGHQNVFGGNQDVFLVKFNSSGSRIWSTYYGGTNVEYSGSIVTDNIGNVYLSGSTLSLTNISFNGHQDTFGGTQDCFLVKFNTAGTRLWATYYGGNFTEYNSRCVVDKFNNVFLAGSTQSSNKISFNGYQNTYGGGGFDLYLAKFNSAGIRQWGTYYGGVGTDETYGCCIDSSSNIYMSGHTTSTTGFSFGGHQNIYGGGPLDAFLMKFNSLGTPQWCTYYGGTSTDYGRSCSVTNLGSVYLTGRTASTTNISFSGHQMVKNGGDDAYIVKFDLSGVRSWGTYLGGIGFDEGYGVSADNIGNVYINGSTTSASSISSNGFQNVYGGGSQDCFLAKYNNAGLQAWSSYIGGSSVESSFLSSIDSLNNLYISGETVSPNFTILNGFQMTIGGGSDAFLLKIKDASTLEISINMSNGNSICTGITLSISHLKNIPSGWSNPKYKWYKNNVLVDTNATYSSSSFITGDSFQCKLIVDSLGIKKDSIWSNVIKITVNTSSSGIKNDTICSGVPYLFNGINRTTSGAYLDTLINNKGCDSFLTLNLYIKPTSVNTTYDTICSNQSKLFNGINRTTSGAYLDTLINSKGCDSFLTLNLSVKSTSSKTIYDTICSNQSKLFNGINRTTSGTYLDTLINSKGCDSFLTLNLYIKSISSNTIFDTICSNQFKLFNGIQQASSGVYLDTLINAIGCDSILSLNLFVKPTSSKSIFDTICDGRSRLYNGVNQTTTGIYLDTFMNSKGCDSIVALNLWVKSISSKTIYDTICSNQSRLFNGINQSVAGLYFDTMVNSNGCDSFITLNLHVKSTSSKTVFDTICANQSKLFNGINRTTSGIYLDTLMNGNGCDSFLFLNLFIKPTSSYAYSHTNCNNQPYFFKGQNRTISGTYKDTLLNSKGCDSIIILTLAIGDSSSKIIFDTICANQSKLFNGIYRTTSGTYLDTLINMKGCDSFLTLNLAVKQISTKTIYDTICSNQFKLFNGFNRNTTGIYLDTLNNSNGCDSFIFLHLFVKSSSQKNIFDTICQGDSIFFNSIWRKTTNTFKDTILNFNGCDSFVYLNLFIKNKTYDTLNVTRCFNIPYLFKGKSLSTSGVYFDTLMNTKGCDSIIRLNLTIIPNLIKPDFDTSLNICFGYTAPALNPTSPNGINGTWMPSIIDNVVSKTYIFTSSQNQCAASTNLQVNIIPLPIIRVNILPNDTICYGDSVRISAIGGTKYKWNNTKSTSSILEYPNQTATYSVSVSDNNCSHTDTARVYVRNLEVEIVGPSNKINKGESIMLYANSNFPISLYEWMPTTYFVNQAKKQVSYTPDQSQKIDLNAKDSFGCRAVSSYFIELKGKDVLVPYIFSPNQDGINDNFKPIYKEGVKILTFKIFNRYGELVYNYFPPALLGWDGIYNGENCPSAIYIYQLEYSIDNKLEKLTGNITLIR
jgi:gliding motility-associated-like protein